MGRCWPQHCYAAFRTDAQKTNGCEVLAELSGAAKWRCSLKLDQLQRAYKLAVKKWIAAIKEEEALASVAHSVAKVDKWEKAHFKEDDIRNKVLEAKKRYEDALREKFYDF
jgi:hypothetical protein